MTISTNQFYYDSQVRRFILQFMRLCSGFQVEFGNNTLRTVPVMYGDPSRQAAMILKQNSENIVNTVPAMAVYVTALEYDRKRIQDPYFVDKRHVRTRKKDPISGELLPEEGNAYTIERIMPVPYDLKLKLDIWTSNTTQKLQILEQIAPLFNPSFEIQSTDNYFDWTSLTTVNLTGVTWSSRSVPVGSNENIDIATMAFSIPIWISPPSKVKKLNITKRALVSIYDINGDAPLTDIDQFNNADLIGNRMKLSPLDYNVILVNGRVTAFRAAEIATPENEDLEPPTLITDSPAVTWQEIFNQYEGKLCPGVSKMTFLQDDGVTEVIGTVTEDPNDPTTLLFTVDTDTIPSNDLGPVDAIIDPLRSGPNAGLPAPVTGTRYLIINGIGNSTDAGIAVAWQGLGGEELIANNNDIIEWDGTKWIVAFDSNNEIGTQHYLTNITTGIQYHWDNDRWVKSFEGEYKAGEWFLIL